ncbi:hypothetical protein CCACVL1_05177, partial [Corchorus capsularis]
GIEKGKRKALPELWRQSFAVGSGGGHGGMVEEGGGTDLKDKKLRTRV